MSSIFHLKNESDEDKRVGYSHKNRLCIAGICLLILIIFNVIIVEAGNHTTRDPNYGCRVSKKVKRIKLNQIEFPKAVQS